MICFVTFEARKVAESAAIPFKHEICLTTYEKTFERDLLRVRKARTPLEEVVFPSPLEADWEVGEERRR